MFLGTSLLSFTTICRSGQDIPEVSINQGNSVNNSPYQQDMTIHQQMPEADDPPPLRRSDRATRGQTRRYDDFVQTILPVHPQSYVPSNCYPYQYPQIMPNQMMTNQMPNQMITNQRPNQMMTNQMMLNQMMTNEMPIQPTMLWY